MNQQRKRKLLITEDDYENQRFLELFLGRKFEVKICDSAETFYSSLENETFDAIIMDISIKGNKDGLQLTREIKSNPRFSNIPVLCYTAHVLHRDRVNAYNAGCDVYLPKPTSNKDLLSAVHKILGEPENFN